MSITLYNYIMKIRLQKNQYIKNCSTDKSFAIDFSKYGEPSMIFLPKKITKLEEIEVTRKGKYWGTEYTIEFPDWLYGKMTDSQKSSISLMTKQWTDEN